MVRDDIVAGLKNAIERGDSLEKAKQSFMSAGYSYEEVEAASHLVNVGVLTPASEEEKLPPSRTQPPMQTEPQLSTQESMQPPTSSQISLPQKPAGGKTKRSSKVILLIIILIILIAVFILTMIFREKIISWFA